MDAGGGSRVMVIHLDRDLTFKEVDSFRQKIDEVLEKGYVNILFDCSDLEFIDSSGIGTLIGLRKRLQSKNGKVGMFGLNDSISRRFRVAKIEDIVGIFRSREEGIKSMGV